MSETVVSLVPNLGHCPDEPSIADALRRLADLVEAGDFPGTCRVVCLLQTDTGIVRRTYGRPTNYAEVIGLLHFAIDGVLNPTSEEE